MVDAFVFLALLLAIMVMVGIMELIGRIAVAIMDWRWKRNRMQKRLDKLAKMHYTLD